MNGMRKKNKSQVLSIRYQDNRISKSVSCFLSYVLILVSCILLPSCGDDEETTIAPKPRAYFRLSFPEKKYVQYDSSCPFRFDMPAYSKIVKNNYKDAEPCWLDLNIPSLNAIIHLTYKEVNGNLNEYLQNTYTYVSSHQIKSSGIREELVSKDSLKVYGIIYNIGGNAASSIQFFLTDSTTHFLRGALYFNAVPNTDSIKPAVDFIKQDIYRLVESFEWKSKK